MLRIVNNTIVLLIFLAVVAAVIGAVKLAGRGFGLLPLPAALAVAAIAAAGVLRMWSRMQSYVAPDYGPELADILLAFARRHDLPVAVEDDMGTNYIFAAGAKLKHELVVRVMDDELDLRFGPYDLGYFYDSEARDDFERMLDAWIAGEARIVAYSGGGHVFEIPTASGWSEDMSTDVGPFRGKPTAIFTNAS